MSVSIWYLLKMALAILACIIAYTLYYFMSVTTKEAEEIGVITPEMGRDPEVIQRIRGETPLSVKKSLDEAIQNSRLSEMADKEVGEDGVVRKK